MRVIVIHLVEFFFRCPDGNVYILEQYPPGSASSWCPLSAVDHRRVARYISVNQRNTASSERETGYYIGGRILSGGFANAAL